MLAAMGLTAALCVLIGIWPKPLYDLLPYTVDFEPYSTEHVVTQLQLLMFSALAFTALMRTGLYPPELRSINLDTDWFYRRGGYMLAVLVADGAQALWEAIDRSARHVTSNALIRLHRWHGPEGILARTWPTGLMAFWTTLMLGAYLLLAYF